MSSVRVLSFPHKGREAKKAQAGVKSGAQHGDKHVAAQEAFGKRVAKRRRNLEARGAARGARSTADQLQLLSTRPGGSTRERKRLEAQLKTENLATAVANAKSKNKAKA